VRVQVNAFILHQTKYGRALTDQLAFRLQLIDELLEEAGIDVRALRPLRVRFRPVTAVASEQRGVALHSVAELPVSDTGRRLMRSCIHCKENGERRETAYFCLGCKVSLCIPCFAQYAHGM